MAEGSAIRTRVFPPWNEQTWLEIVFAILYLVYCNLIIRNMKSVWWYSRNVHLLRCHVLQVNNGNNLLARLTFHQGDISLFKCLLCVFLLVYNLEKPERHLLVSLYAQRLLLLSAHVNHRGTQKDLDISSYFVIYFDFSRFVLRLLTTFLVDKTREFLSIFFFKLFPYLFIFGQAENIIIMILTFHWS